MCFIVPAHLPPSLVDLSQYFSPTATTFLHGLGNGQ